MKHFIILTTGGFNYYVFYSMVKKRPVGLIHFEKKFVCWQQKFTRKRRCYISLADVMEDSAFLLYRGFYVWVAGATTIPPSSSELVEIDHVPTNIGVPSALPSSKIVNYLFEVNFLSILPNKLVTFRPNFSWNEYPQHSPVSI